MRAPKMPPPVQHLYIGLDTEEAEELRESLRVCLADLQQMPEDRIVLDVEWRANAQGMSGYSKLVATVREADWTP